MELKLTPEELIPHLQQVVAQQTMQLIEASAMIQKLQKELEKDDASA